MVRDPVERQVRRLIGRIPPVVERSRAPMSIRQIAAALDYYTTAPWCVVFAVDRLERRGVLQRTASRKGSLLRWQLAHR